MSKDTLLQPPASPTGRPVLPAWLAPYVAAICIVAGVVMTELPEGSPWLKVCRVVVALGIAFGALSPGWRR